MKRWNISWDALLVMSVVIVAGVCSQSQQVAHADDEAKEEGRVIKISPDAEATIPLADETKVTDVSYWLGIRGRGVQNAVLRTQLQLAVDMGIVVEDVVEKSPAEKAGLRKHDIILRANGEAVHEMKVLLNQLSEHGEKPIELELIRLGKEETIVVVPERRPIRVENGRGESLRKFGGGGGGFGAGGGGFGAGGRGDGLRQLLEQLQQDGGLQAGMRMLGPGIVVGGNAFGQTEMPDGVSLSVTRKNGEPAQITIKRGEETWNIVGDDAKAIEQLPEDLRPLAEQALQQGQGGGFGAMDLNFNKQLEGLIPRGLKGFRGGGGIVSDPRQDLSQVEKELSKRMKQMEKDLQKLQERLLDQEPVTADELPAQ